MESGRPGMESQANERAENGLTARETGFRLQKGRANSNPKRIIWRHTSACLKKKAPPNQNLPYCWYQCFKSD
jgi:hypothetical protein